MEFPVSQTLLPAGESVLVEIVEKEKKVNIFLTKYRGCAGRKRCGIVKGRKPQPGRDDSDY